MIGKLHTICGVFLHLNVTWTTTTLEASMVSSRALQSTDSRTCLIGTHVLTLVITCMTNHNHEVTDPPKLAFACTRLPQRDRHVLATTNPDKPQMSQHMGAMIGQWVFITSSSRLKRLGFCASVCA